MRKLRSNFQGRESVFEFGAVAHTLNSLLLGAQAPADIDLLSLGVDGGELEVHKGIDHKSCRFKYMLIECRDLSRLSLYSRQQGYRFLERLSEHDCLFFSDV